VVAAAGGACAQPLAEKAGSGPQTQAIHLMSSSESNLHTPLTANSFSAYCMYQYSGAGNRIRCLDAGINENSRVFAQLSEYAGDPQKSRFVGDARLTVHNVVPFNGGVEVWTDVEWPRPLNVRLDILVDP